MKKILYFSLIISLTIVSCTQEKKYPLEGTWKQIGYDKQFFTDTSFQAIVKNGQIKTFSKEYFTFVGHSQDDTSSYESYGAGTYTLNGEKYEEHIIYHNIKSYIGTRFKAFDKIRNDTLFHTRQADDNWKLMPDAGTEIYVRLK